jgi:hypothetical protein
MKQRGTFDAIALGVGKEGAEATAVDRIEQEREQ